MTLRSKSSSRAGQWCLPGGGIHQDETPEEACSREVFEETGLTVKPTHCLFQIEKRYYFRCELLSPARQFSVKPNENEQVAWVDTHEFEQLDIMEYKTILPILTRMGWFDD